MADAEYSSSKKYSSKGDFPIKTNSTNTGMNNKNEHKLGKHEL